MTHSIPLVTVRIVALVFNPAPPFVQQEPAQFIPPKAQQRTDITAALLRHSAQSPEAASACQVHQCVFSQIVSGMPQSYITAAQLLTDFGVQFVAKPPARRFFRLARPAELQNRTAFNHAGNAQRGAARGHKISISKGRVAQAVIHVDHSYFISSKGLRKEPQKAHGIAAAGNSQQYRRFYVQPALPFQHVSESCRYAALVHRHPPPLRFTRP